MAVTRKPMAKKLRVRRAGLRVKRKKKKSPAKIVFITLGAVAAVAVIALSVNAFSSGGTASTGSGTASGGFLSGIFGGGSGGAATASSGDNDRESGGGSSGFFSRFFGGGSGGAATASSSGGGKAEPYFKIFSSGTYHMKAKGNVEGIGEEVVFDQYVKGGMTATVTDMGGESVRSVIRDNKSYGIMDAQRMVVVTSINSADPSQGAIQTKGFSRSGSGTARFNGRNLPYEEYSWEKGSKYYGNGDKYLFFLDGNKLAGVRGIVGKYTVEMVVLSLDKNVPANIFDIPSGYTVIEM